MTSASPSGAPPVMNPQVHSATTKSETPLRASDVHIDNRGANNGNKAKTYPVWKLSGLLFNVIVPIGILCIGAFAVAALGSIDPKSRVADDETIASRLRRLPAAQVLRVLSLEEIGKPLELRVDGVVVPYREVAIAAEVSGRVVKKSPQCETGSYVTKGQLLVEIDSTDYEQEIDRLTRMREQDYAALVEVDQEVTNANRLVKVAADDVSLQEREVKRLESMPAGFASEGEVDRARKSLLMAVQSEVTFQNQLNLLSTRRSKLEAAERLATTQLRTAEINLQRTKIYSPADGVVVQENAELNSFIQRGSPIATLNDVSKAEVAVNLRMDQLHWVLDQQRSDSEAIAKVDGGKQSESPGYTIPPTPAIIEYTVSGRTDSVFRWDGTLIRYDGIGLDPQSRTVPVVIVVDRPQEFKGTKPGRADTTPSPLVRGMFVTVRLLIQPQTPLVAIPSVAIQPGNRVWQFVPDDGVLESSGTSGLSDAMVANPDAAVSVNTASQTENKVDTKSTDEFDPSAWQAGRVMVRRNVMPVDSLWLSDADDAVSENRVLSSKLGDRRYWICEIGGGEVNGGSWIVSSPLGEFDDTLTVRVPKSDLK